MARLHGGAEEQDVLQVVELGRGEGRRGGETRRGVAGGRAFSALALARFQLTQWEASRCASGCVNILYKL